MHKVWVETDVTYDGCRAWQAICTDCTYLGEWHHECVDGDAAEGYATDDAQDHTMSGDDCQ